MGQKRYFLGTANFGASYGYFDRKFSDNFDTINNLLHASVFSGFDFALSYGLDFERVKSLGSIGLDNTVKFKLSDFKNLHNDVNEMVLELQKYLEVSNCLMFHDISDLESNIGRQLLHALEELRNLGTVPRIGVSVYNEEDLERTLTYFIPDEIQVPINLANREMVESSIVKEIRLRYGVRLSARSIFMQGMLLQNPQIGKFPSTEIQEFVKDLSAWCHSRGVSVLELALSFAIHINQIDCIVLGSDDMQQALFLSDLISRIETSNLLEFPSFECSDKDPRKWKK